MYDYFELVKLYEKSKNEINELKCKNYDLKNKIETSLKEIDELQQAIFGLEDKMWIYDTLKNIVDRLKGE